MNFRTHIYRIY